MTRYYLKPTSGGRTVAKRINEGISSKDCNKKEWFGYVITDVSGDCIETKTGFETPWDAFDEGLEKLKRYRTGFHSLNIEALRPYALVNGFGAYIVDGKVHDRCFACYA